MFAQAISTLRRSRSTRYVAAAVSAIFVVSTLYYVQVPHSGEYLPHWTDSVPTQDQAPSSSDYLWDTRAAQVKQAFRHAYSGYKRYANGYDELRPLSNTAVNNFNGWNVSMYDSLDTMILMGLWDEFADALPVVQHGDFREGPWTRSQYAPFFETAIRYLGGLLAAYALSGESILLDRASDLATLLEPAFNTPEGLPRFGVNTNTTATTPALSGIFAEVASCQLEWTYAAHATGNKTHYDKASKVISTLADAMEDRQGGMFPTHWHLSTGRPTSESRSVGAAADSGHEYLLKQYLLTGKTDIENLEMYLLSMNEVLTRLLYITPERGLLYVTETSGKGFTASHTFEHLACFFPGLLALGAHTLDLNLSDIDRNRLNPEARRQYDILIKYDLKSLHMAAAEGLATSCWLMYADQPSGLGPEVVADRQGKLWIEAVEEWRKGGKHGPLPGLGEKKPIMYTRPEKSTIAGGPWDYVVRRTEYFLRPETIESIYIMWRTTGNPVWRERGWAIFEAIERETKTASGYASLKKVTQSPGLQMDDQPSYFLAETLKYLYLLFKNEDLVPLDKWVFNTEAHPLPIFTWSDWQKHKFGIPR
ncbi:seven-hairpin glycosidase [Trametes versicolor FP-101664 SS1]|uniref:seven-hairpin glycosidase n=1 Tax=Trametes versicolor (strain FP-101664) TaxID=717944 RepID=UPI0004624360|nr:seven-hairpin glycosidase [Trametes versicolor FP-101664 SS1]EIW58472.1 seven-hairpin glycosidase [Trametes versicolor FP-101664 SS1]